MGYGSGYGMKKEKKKKPTKKPMKKKGVITDAQNKKLKEHSVHHTKKHMAMMRRLMRSGKSFTVAHRETQKKVGK
jgi:hypothetical protein